MSYQPTEMLYLDKTSTERRFVYLPKRCHVTNKILWLRYAVFCTCYYADPTAEPGSEMEEVYHWCDETTYLQKIIKDEHIWDSLMFKKYVRIKYVY